MPASVTLQLPDASRRTLVPGDLVGRMPSAALHLTDIRISEAHGLISLRGAQLKLLALRGRFVVDGKVETDVVLEEGLVVEPAPGLELTVVEVVLPQAVLALEGDGLGRQVLRDPSSLFLLPRPALEPKYVPDAAAHLWTVGADWRLQIKGHEAQALTAGDVFSIGSIHFRAVLDQVAPTGLADTRLDQGPQAPLQLVTRYDTVHLHRQGEPTVSLDGLMARIVSELAAMNGSAPWEAVAAEVWPEEQDRNVLRRRWDVYLARLRRKLRQAGVRPSLVRANGRGAIELHLLPHDTVDDRG